MNEPWAGTDALSNQDRFDTGPYKDFLDRMIAAIRSEDSENWIFFEPRAYGPNDGSPSVRKDQAGWPLPASVRPSLSTGP